MRIEWKDEIPLQIDLEQTASSGQCFRWQAAGGGAYRVPNGEKCLAIAPGSVPGRVRVDVTAEEFARDWADYFDAGRDYAAICRSAQEDSFLCACAAVACGVRVLRQDAWEMLITFTISQNNNIPRIRASVDKLCRRFGHPVAKGVRGCPALYSFPAPEALRDVKKLKGLGLGYRDRYLAALADGVCTGAIDLDALKKMPYAQAHAYLTGLFGVGVKVANCVCLFGLGHADAFPVDTWIKKILDAEYREGFPLEKYPGCAGIVQQWMFYAVQSGQVELKKEEKTPRI